FYGSVAHRYLHSFPTRRSSDLVYISMVGFAYFITKLAYSYATLLFYLTYCGYFGLFVFLDLAFGKIPFIIAVDEQVVAFDKWDRSEAHTSELESLAYLVCRLLL